MCLEGVLDPALPVIGLAQAAERLETAGVELDGRLKIGDRCGQVPAFKPDYSAIDEKGVMELAILRLIAQKRDCRGVVGLGVVKPVRRPARVRRRCRHPSRQLPRQLSLSGVGDPAKQIEPNTSGLLV